jgi:hypothetical protein
VVESGIATDEACASNAALRPIENAVGTACATHAAPDSGVHSPSSAAADSGARSSAEAAKATVSANVNARMPSANTLAAAGYAAARDVVAAVVPAAVPAETPACGGVAGCVASAASARGASALGPCASVLAQEHTAAAAEVEAGCIGAVVPTKATVPQTMATAGPSSVAGSEDAAGPGGPGPAAAIAGTDAVSGPNSRAQRRTADPETGRGCVSAAGRRADSHIVAAAAAVAGTSTAAAAAPGIGSAQAEVGSMRQRCTRWARVHYTGPNTRTRCERNKETKRKLA